MRAEDEMRGHKRMGAVMQALAWLALLALGLVFFSDVLDRQYNPNQNLQTRKTQAGAQAEKLTGNPLPLC
jgi:aspartyl protease family protein